MGLTAVILTVSASVMPPVARAADDLSFMATMNQSLEWQSNGTAFQQYAIYALTPGAEKIFTRLSDIESSKVADAGVYYDGKYYTAVVPTNSTYTNYTSTFAVYDTETWTRSVIATFGTGNGNIAIDMTVDYTTGTVYAIGTNVYNGSELQLKKVDLSTGEMTRIGALGANILLSTNPQASTKEECICIQLVNGTQPRINLNLIDNPGLLGAEIMVQGDVMKYNTFPGIKNTSDYSILSQPVGPDQPDVPTGGDGTEASPYAVGSIIAMAPSSTTEAVKEDVWAEGYLVGYYKDYAAHFTAEGAQAANILLAATATASTKEECICIQLVNGSDVRKALNLIDNPGNLGKKVSVRGDVMKYNSLPGIKNTDAYKIDGQGGGDQPDTPTGDAIFEETFEGGTLGNFTATVETSGSWTGWRANTRTPLCAIANSYVNSANEAATAWLISPEISLNGVSNATLSFEHAFGFYFPTSQDAFCTVYVREKGGSWNQLTLTNFPAKGTGNWTSFAANTFSLSAYAGKTIEVGFKYMNDGKQSVAWEIKNFKVTK